MNLELRTKFSCAHYYHNPEFSKQQNIEHFGKCYSEYGHGHDYELCVTFEIISLDSVESQAKELRSYLREIHDHLDHQHLNKMIPYFQDCIPTTENLTKYCYLFLTEKAPHHKIKKVALFERSDLWSELNF